MYSLRSSLFFDSRNCDAWNKKTALTYWFKATWWFTTRKSGVNAINLKDLLGFGSYQTAWTWLHKLRHCTIRGGRERLRGDIEVEFYIGGQKPGKRGRGANAKTIVVAAVEKRGKRLGRIRLQVVPNCSAYHLKKFTLKNITPGSTIKTDGWRGYSFLNKCSYKHKIALPAHIAEKNKVLPGVHLVTSLVKRLMLGTFQGRFSPNHLQSYLDEYL